MRQKAAAQGKSSRAARLGAATLSAIGALCFLAQGAIALPPQVTKARVSKVTGTTAVLEAEVNPQGVKTGFHFEYGTEDCSKTACTPIPEPDGEAGSGSSPVTVSVELKELTPGTIYHFVAVAKNEGGQTMKSPDRVFATLGIPFEGLPDGRAYEQASPVDKDGGDAVGELGLVKAASTGNGISFGSTFGIPSGKGAQALPTYLATRGAGQSGWSMQGLLPPASFGERALVRGWLPDFSEVFSGAVKLGSPRSSALVGEPTDGKAPTQITPYAAKASYSYAGASADASSILFEAPNDLPHKEGTALEGASNVYAYDKASGELSLASVLNDGTSPPKGAFAGPYNWLQGISGVTLGQGGSARGYYLQEEHAISSSGDVVFTEAGSGQLYLRKNPTAEQSALDGSGRCEDAAIRACTLHVSESKRGEPDPAGPQPAAFQAASTDGSKVFFTSPEKLTDDANTGPVPPVAAIGIGGIGGGIENASFIPTHAVGLAADSEYVYWADPGTGSIGRAKLNGEEVIPAFIGPGAGECETEADPEGKPGAFEKVSVPSTPRYVAVDSEHIYWTNTGRRAKNGEPLDGGGTIGRAKLDGTSIEPAFICGEDKAEPTKKRVSNPQGIAVNGSHIYWANAAEEIPYRSIARAAVDGSSVKGGFFPVTSALRPFGMALSSTHVYFTAVENVGSNSYVIRIPLEGGEERLRFIGNSVLRGIAVDSAHVYWAAQAEHAIGRADLELENRETEFTTGIEGALNGLAATPTNLYWSVNGETPINPGNDLYRYQPAGEALSDLTPDPGDENGAEVLGVLGAAADGSRLYFAANGNLDGGGPAKAEDCRTFTPHASMNSLAGTCNLYLWEEGEPEDHISLVARVNAHDATDWAATTTAVFGGAVPKTSFVSKDGATLLFRSREQLSAYDNEGTSELYRFHVGDPAIRCVSCQPQGEASGAGPSLGVVKYPRIEPVEGAQVASRNLSADGNRAFFETVEALVPADTNGAGGCPTTGTELQLFRACLDVYEWEAPGTAGSSCKEGGPAYSILNGGCIYLISSGKSPFPSLFADASESGEDVFFYTRQSLVGQDEDELQDVYDARVGGGLAAQNPIPVVPCEGAEACHGPAQAPPSEASPGTATFVGPANPASKHKKPKAKKQKHKKKHPKKKRANVERGAGR
jgi:hypothetical protein